MFNAIYCGNIPIPMYSLLLFIGVVCYFITYFNYAEKIEKIDRISSNRILFISILSFPVLGLSALIFNSIFHSIEEGEIIIGGITWLGGVIGLLPFMVFMFHKFVPKTKGNALNLLSLVMPGIVIAHAFGRMGCFCAGCCYGKVTNSIFGVVFPENSSAALTYPGLDGRSLPVFPTQLFEAIFEILLFTFMIIFRKKLKYKNVEIYLIAYGIFRFLLEFLRGDDRGSTGLVLSPSQFICILLIITAVLLILFKKNIVFKKLYSQCCVWQKEAETYVYQPKSQANNTISQVSIIKELFELKQVGAITEEEYLKKKEQLLKKIE